MNTDLLEFSRQVVEAIPECSCPSWRNFSQAPHAGNAGMDALGQEAALVRNEFRRHDHSWSLLMGFVLHHTLGQGHADFFGSLLRGLDGVLLI